MTARATAATAPDFTLHGELTPALISAIARLLISHARRELEAERQAAEPAAENGKGAHEHGGQRDDGDARSFQHQ